MNRKLKKNIYNVAAIAALLIGAIYVCSRFVHLGNVEYTDNAYVQRNVVPVNTRIQGFIKEIRFKEYTKVHKGDTLAIIEDSEYKLNLAKAELSYQIANAGKSATSSNIQTTMSNIMVKDAAIEENRIKLENAKRDYERYRKLLEQNSVTQQQFDNVNTIYLAEKARHEQLMHSRNSTSMTKSSQGHILKQNELSTNVAEAEISLAQLNLSYTVIVAPVDGTTGRKTINEGELVQPGQTLVDIISNEEIYIIANYRETQLSNIKEGNDVTVKADAIPNKQFTGTVTCIAGATGAAVSLIPHYNATGNFFKVEQRVPVKISITDAEPCSELLRAGLSVECEVKY